jgi:cytochrome P450
MLDGLAHAHDPYPAYAALRSNGVHQPEDDRWVVARAADVTAVLASPDAVVGFAPAGGGVQAQMARFSDGEAHSRRRETAVTRLAGIAPEELRASARDLTLRRLEGAGEVEVMSTLARHVPVATLATALGATDPDAAVEATRALALALAPPLGHHRGDLSTPAFHLAALLTPAAPLDDVTVNVLALLFQTIDATAGLIGNSLITRTRLAPPSPDTLAARTQSGPTDPAALAARGRVRPADTLVGRVGPASIDALVVETTRFDPSVQLTTRVAVAPIPLGDVTIPAGGRVVVLLAAANRDPERYARPDEFDPSRSGPAALTFGGGSRPCPGDAHALALAAGVLDGLDVLDATLTTPPYVIDYEPRANLRIPADLVVRLT